MIQTSNEAFQVHLEKSIQDVSDERSLSLLDQFNDHEKQQKGFEISMNIDRKFRSKDFKLVSNRANPDLRQI
jgi:hypothetical protein